MALRLLCRSAAVVSLLLSLAYMAVDAMFLFQGSGFTFLVSENVFWMVLYLASAYLCYTASRHRAIVMLVAGANAGRVSRSIVDPYGVVGTAMIQVHAPLLAVILLLGGLVFLSILAEKRFSADRKE